MGTGVGVGMGPRMQKVRSRDSTVIKGSPNFVTSGVAQNADMHALSNDGKSAFLVLAFQVH